MDQSDAPQPNITFSNGKHGYSTVNLASLPTLNFRDLS
jgi:hypothetical protein